MILITDTKPTQFYFQVHCLAAFIQRTLKTKYSTTVTTPITVHFSTYDELGKVTFVS